MADNPLGRIMKADEKRDPHQDAEVGRLRAVRGGLDVPSSIEVGRRYAEKRGRKQKRKQRREVPLTEDLPLNPDPIDSLMIAAEVEHLLGRLPDRERAALVLKYLHFLSANEVGEILGLSPESAHNLLSESLAKLRSHRSRSLDK